MKQIFFRLIALAALVMVTGCASITGGNSQQVFVQVKAASGVAVEAAECVVSNDKGNWIVRPPGDLTVARSNLAMQIKCTKAAEPAGSVSVESGTRAAMYGNILFGGLIGAGVDHVSGAAYEYPGVATVVMGQHSQLKMAYAPGSGSGRGPSATARLIPAQTRFAALDDVAAVPLPERLRQGYRTFLTRKSPRAFALSANGHYASATGLRPTDTQRPSDPALRALEVCRATARMECRLYAVDDSVVYVPPVAGEAAAALPVPPKNRYEIPAESSFADLNDATLVPVREQGRGSYLRFLTLPSPRAFAIRSDGGWVIASNSATAMADVLNTCEREGKTCWLYAVDDRVVWVSEVNQRIGQARQLVPARPD